MAIGIWPDGQASAIENAVDTPPVERGPIEDSEVVRHLTQRIAEIAERIRARMDRMGVLDLVSQDIFIGVVRELEETPWMIRTQLATPTP